MRLWNRHSKDAPGGAADRGDGLARDLIVVLTLKVLFLFAIWFAFFHHPDTPDLTPKAVQHWMLDSAAGSPGRATNRQETD